MEPRVLILTPHMSPHRVATWEEAIVYMLDGTADVLEEYEATVSSPSVTLRIPAVMRLRKEIRSHKNGIKFSRINVLARDGFRCCYCGDRKKPRELTYDHVLPRCRGGKTIFQNIVSACRSCNTRKGRRTPQEAGMRMHFKPFVPKTLPISMPFLFDVGAMPAEWLPYVVAEVQIA